MNNEVRNIINNYISSPKRIIIKNNAKILETNDNIFVFKKNKNKNINHTYNYLKSRAFDYFPELINYNDEYQVYQYINEVEYPDDQKAIDIMNLMSLLHSKTTFYKEIDLDDYKEIYEETEKKQEYLYNYYSDIISVIEEEIYMSPSEYLIARNISYIFYSLKKSRDYLEKWYNGIKEKRTKRVVNIHNNVDLSHYIKDHERGYFISWDQSKIDNPIFDIYHFYKKNYLDLDFNHLLNVYESRYPLTDNEKDLLFSLLLIPEKIELINNEYENCKKIRKVFDYLYKTNELETNYRKPERAKE